MADVTFKCPVCNQDLGNVRGNAPIKLRVYGSAKQEARDVGGHVHIEIQDDFDCVNGHVWRLHDLMLDRVG